MRRWLYRATMLLAVVGVAGFLLAAPVSANDNGTDGYLTNGGFEGSFYATEDELVADGWTRLHLEGSPDWMSTQVFAGGGWVEKIAGENSHILSVEDLGIGQPFRTVLYQQVHDLTPGQPYSFSGWILKMWGGSANQTPPTDPFSFGSRVGIDPTGGTDPLDASRVLWSDYHWETRVGTHPNPDMRAKFNDQWIAAVAQNSTITVFVEVWHKWQRAESQAIVDAMELFDAPTATLHTPSGAILEEPYLDWSGVIPQSLLDRGAFEMFYLVQKRQGDQWVTIAERLQNDEAPLPLVWGESVELRVVPHSFQVAPWGVWPPTTHTGLPTPPITVTYGPGDTTPPAVSVDPLPRWQNVNLFPLSWSGSDDSGGALSYDVEYRRAGEEAWSAWLTGATGTSAVFGEGSQPAPLAGGDEWEFRVRARDAAGNNSEWVQSGRSGLATTLVTGQVLAVNGERLPGAYIVVEPYEFSEMPALGPVGEYLIPLGTPDPHTLSFFDREGNQRLPDTTIAFAPPTLEKDWYLPPPDTTVANGHFEDAESGWLGSWTQSAPGASGQYEALIAPLAVISQTVDVSAGDGLSMMVRRDSGVGALQVRLGEESWTIVPDEPVHWFEALESEGPQTLSLEAVGGYIWVDEVAVGEPQEPPILLFLPVVSSEGGG